MKLTGKCKEDFLKYLNELPVAPYEVMLDNIPQCYLNALIVDFLDLVGFKIIIIPTMFIDSWGSDIFGWTECLTLELESRQEAINVAIIKANELFNNSK